MNPIRIFAVPSHISKERVSGVDFARVIQPMEALSKNPDFDVSIYDPKLNEETDWLEVTADNDILFLNYTTNPWSFAIMGCLARKNNRKIVMDIDDALWLVRQDNTAYEAFKKGSEGIESLTAICNEVDYITTTSPYLKNVICKYADIKPSQVVVLPNFIDLDLYDHRSVPKNNNQVTICHYGSSSHYKDLQNSGFVDGVDMLMKSLPNVSLLTVGALIPKFKHRWGPRYRQDFGDVDVYRWIKNKFPGFMDEADIVVAPLDSDVYNCSKSYIKFLEYSSARKPGVYQDITPYREIVDHRKNGFLASKSKDWYRYMKRLVLNFELRKSIGEAAFETVGSHTIQGNISKYEDFFRMVIES